MNDTQAAPAPDSRPTIRDASLAGYTPPPPKRLSPAPSTTGEALEHITDQHNSIKKSLDVLIADLTTLRLQM